MNILFATSEVHPLIKTGGLADVSAQLPKALQSYGASVSIILPAYASVLDALARTKTIAELTIDGHNVHILQTQLPGTRVKLWLVDCPDFFARPGNPYLDQNGNDWPDNAERFALFAKTIRTVALNQASLDWPVDIVHCNDWQTGLVPALLKLENDSPPSVFTIHNLAYQGVFPYETLHKLGLPNHYWSHHALEFHGQLSFMKGGLAFADHINTVSPNYAEEIKTPEFGCGLDGLLRHRSDALQGILNGIDTQEWNPNQDPHINQHYNQRSIDKKHLNKPQLQALFELPENLDIPIIGMVSRFTEQKGFDLITAMLPRLLTQPLQVVILGSGDKTLEYQLQSMASQYPDKLSVKIAYNESWAHLVIAAADMFLMPSRFEPCGLTQLYSLRYGTIPIVRRVGGLANTVVDTNQISLDDNSATGFVFDEANANALLSACTNALNHFADKPSWKRLQLNAMKQTFSWKQSAKTYMALYEILLKKAQIY